MPKPIVKPKLKEKVIREFYEFILNDLQEREQEITRLVEIGQLGIDALPNEKRLGNLTRQVLSGYVLRYLDAPTN